MSAGSTTFPAANEPANANDAHIPAPPAVAQNPPPESACANAGPCRQTPQPPAPNPGRSSAQSGYSPRAISAPPAPRPHCRPSPEPLAPSPPTPEWPPATPPPRRRAKCPANRPPRRGFAPAASIHAFPIRFERSTHSCSVFSEIGGESRTKTHRRLKCKPSANPSPFLFCPVFSRFLLPYPPSGDRLHRFTEVLLRRNSHQKTELS